MLAEIEDSAFCMISAKVTTASEIRVLLKEKVTFKIDGNSAVDITWQRLSTYWDFNSFALLEQLIYEFGDESLIASMRDYSSRLEEFRCRTCLSDFAMHSIKIAKMLPNEEFSDFVIQLDQSPNNYMLNKLENLRENLTSNLSFPKFTMILQNITFSDFTAAVNWAIPAGIAASLKEHNIMDDASVLTLCKEYQVVCITIDGKRYIAIPQYLRATGFSDKRPFRDPRPGRHSKLFA